jgi:hypothetical protein
VAILITGKNSLTTLSEAFGQQLTVFSPKKREKVDRQQTVAFEFLEGPVFQARMRVEDNLDLPDHNVVEKVDFFFFFFSLFFHRIIE